MTAPASLVEAANTTALTALISEISRYRRDLDQMIPGVDAGRISEHYAFSLARRIRLAEHAYRHLGGVFEDWLPATARTPQVHR